MQYVSAREIREGMCVAQNIDDDHGRCLLMRGQLLGRHHIVRLRKFGINGLFIDPTHGEQVVKPTSSEIRDACQKMLSKSVESVSKEFGEKKIVLDKVAINACVDHLVAALMKSKKPMVTLIDIDAGSDRLMQHSVNTAVLATILAIDLRVPVEMIKHLAVAMLFHDIGTVFLPEELASDERNAPPNAAEILEFRKHPTLGYERLIETDAISEIASSIVLRHHEALDGSGYPEGAKAETLSQLMKIAAVVEAYDSLTSNRFGIPAVLPDAAISYIIGNANKLFAREVVISLCRRTAIYPKGVAVQLNTGERGVVAGVVPTAPTRPVVLLQVDRTGKTLKSPLIVDLSREASYAIIRSAATVEELTKAVLQASPPVRVNPIYAWVG